MKHTKYVRNKNITSGNSIATGLTMTIKLQLVVRTRVLIKQISSTPSYKASPEVHYRHVLHTPQPHVCTAVPLTTKHPTPWQHHASHATASLPHRSHQQLIPLPQLLTRCMLRCKRRTALQQLLLHTSRTLITSSTTQPHSRIALGNCTSGMLCLPGN